MGSDDSDACHARSAIDLFEVEILRTEPRRRIFFLFDGRNPPKEVGDLAGYTDQGVRDLVKFLEPRGFISLVPGSAAQIASPNFEAILAWYFEQSHSGHS